VIERETEIDSAIFPGMAQILGGDFIMGSNEFYPEERPARMASVGAFWIDKFAVTNTDFERFVTATGYVTTAETAPSMADYPEADPSMLKPGSAVFKTPTAPASLSGDPVWWHYEFGACWRQPEGPGSDIRARGDHPVVHVSFDDALSYASWCGKSLPTEAEWEFAARGGLLGARYAWGHDLTPSNVKMANYWTGSFPYHRSSALSDFLTTPVGSYPPNAYGLHDMIGNVWEWTLDPFNGRPHGTRPCCGADRSREEALGPRVIKGGSYLCAENYCRRYRPAARHAQDARTTTSHLGFRCVVRERTLPST